MKFNEFWKHAGRAFRRHGTAILIGTGAVGMVVTVVLAVDATPKAMKLIEAETEKKDAPLTAKETVKAAWKPYIPTGVTCVLSLVCLGGAIGVHEHQYASIAAAYALTNADYRALRDKVSEVVGEKKMTEVEDSLAKDALAKSESSGEKTIIVTNKGNTLFYETISGRYFRADIDQIRRGVNEFNKQLNLSYDNQGSLNDLYYCWGLTNAECGEDRGWRLDREGLVDVFFSAQLTEDEEPCIVIGFRNPPVYNFER